MWERNTTGLRDLNSQLQGTIYTHLSMADCHLSNLTSLFGILNPLPSLLQNYRHWSLAEMSYVEGYFKACTHLDGRSQTTSIRKLTLEPLISLTIKGYLKCRSTKITPGMASSVDLHKHRLNWPFSSHSETTPGFSLILTDPCKAPTLWQGAFPSCGPIQQLHVIQFLLIPTKEQSRCWIPCSRGE